MPQAGIYDTTRKRLLCGREDMLALVVAQLQSRHESSTITHKPVWYDMGGGTGYNIEVMDKLVGIEAAFSHVFLVDFSPSLCAVAKERVKSRAWKNVTILCQDARTVQCSPGSADLITMSYSLSMIPDFYSVIDMMTNILAPTGIIGIVDFYVQSIVDVSSRNYIGGTFNRHVNWLGRLFWRAWFDADRVNLDAGRRDYVEYRFGTVLSSSDRNYLLGGIPYYLFVGCRRDADTSNIGSQEMVQKFDASLTESPYLSSNEYRKQQTDIENANIVHSKSYESAIVNLSSNLPLPATFYQKNPWRIHYNELLKKHQQFNNEYIYAFNWEDPKVDRQLLGINKDDVILTITSAGDNILDYLLESPRRVHAVDLNPNQNHLLELKVAAFTTLPHSDVWQLFAEGRHPNFRDLLITKLSPHLSSQAFQYWLDRAGSFSSKHGLYETGGSRHAIKLLRRLFRLCGLTSKIQTMCNVETLNEQREIWPQIRDVLLSWPLHKAVVSTEWWAWKAAGVPPAQRKMFVDDYAQRTGRPSNKKICGEAVWQYVVDTLDPVVETTQLSSENYFYYICLQGRYSKK
jgi:betaine lipid synthase